MKQGPFPQRYTRITSEIRKKFLKLLAGNGGIVRHACRDLGVSPDKMYHQRKRYPKFRKAWEVAIDRGIDRMEDEAKRRAMDGHEEPIYYKGKLAGYRRVPSDALLTLILKAHRPHYGRQEITGPGGAPLGSNVVIYLPDNGRKRDVPKNGDRGAAIPVGETDDET